MKNSIYSDRDLQVRAEAFADFAEECTKVFKSMQFHTGPAWFDFDAAIDRCVEAMDKVAQGLSH